MPRRICFLFLFFFLVFLWSFFYFSVFFLSKRWTRMRGKKKHDYFFTFFYISPPPPPPPKLKKNFIIWDARANTEFFFIPQKSWSKKRGELGKTFRAFFARTVGSTRPNKSNMLCVWYVCRWKKTLFSGSEFYLQNSETKEKLFLGHSTQTSGRGCILYGLDWIFRFFTSKHFYK